VPLSKEQEQARSRTPKRIAWKKAYAKREDVRERKRKWMREHYWPNVLKGSDQEKFRRVKHRYGISQAEFKAILKKQNEACALCDKPLKLKSKSVHIDHCHNSKVVRGVLCAKCNVGIGRFGDNTEGVLRALAYLERTDPEPTWRNFYGQ
jgi:hypothetical protein